MYMMKEEYNTDHFWEYYMYTGHVHEEGGI